MFNVGFGNANDINVFLIGKLLVYQHRVELPNDRITFLIRVVGIGCFGGGEMSVIFWVTGVSLVVFVR